MVIISSHHKSVVYLSLSLLVPTSHSFSHSFIAISVILVNVSQPLRDGVPLIVPKYEVF